MGNPGYMIDACRIVCLIGCSHFDLPRTRGLATRMGGCNPLFSNLGLYSLSFHNGYFLRGQFIEFINQLVDLPVGRINLALEQGLLVADFCLWQLLALQNKGLQPLVLQSWSILIALPQWLFLPGSVHKVHKPVCRSAGRSRQSGAESGSVLGRFWLPAVVYAGSLSAQPIAL